MAPEISIMINQLKHNELTEISLQNGPYNQDELVALAEALKVNSSLQAIDLSGNPLSSTTVIALAEMLKVNCSLKSIKLRKCRINDEGVSVLAEALKTNNGLTSLDLSRNAFTGVLDMGRALFVNTTVTSLNHELLRLDHELFKRLYVNDVYIKLQTEAFLERNKNIAKFKQMVEKVQQLDLSVEKNFEGLSEQLSAMEDLLETFKKNYPPIHKQLEELFHSLYATVYLKQGDTLSAVNLFQKLPAYNEELMFLLGEQIHYINVNEPVFEGKFSWDDRNKTAFAVLGRAFKKNEVQALLKRIALLMLRSSSASSEQPALGVSLLVPEDALALLLAELPHPGLKKQPEKETILHWLQTMTPQALYDYCQQKPFKKAIKVAFGSSSLATLESIVRHGDKFPVISTGITDKIPYMSEGKQEADDDETTAQKEDFTPEVPKELPRDEVTEPFWDISRQCWLRFSLNKDRLMVDISVIDEDFPLLSTAWQPSAQQEGWFSLVTKANPERITYFRLNEGKLYQSNGSIDGTTAQPVIEEVDISSGDTQSVKPSSQLLNVDSLMEKAVSVNFENLPLTPEQQQQKWLKLRDNLRKESLKYLSNSSSVINGHSKKHQLYYLYSLFENVFSTATSNFHSCFRALKQAQTVGSETYDALMQHVTSTEFEDSFRFNQWNQKDLRQHYMEMKKTIFNSLVAWQIDHIDTAFGLTVFKNALGVSNKSIATSSNLFDPSLQALLHIAEIEVSTRNYRDEIIEKIEKYQRFKGSLTDWHIRDLRKKPGFFSRIRHYGTEGHNRAETIKEDLQKAKSIDAMNTVIARFLNDEKTPYHHNSLSAFVLDALVDMDSPWNALTEDTSGHYNRQEISEICESWIQSNATEADDGSALSPQAP